MISIVIPLFNKEKTIVSTLESVLKQTFQDYEVLVVDDGSTDESLKQVLSVDDSRIRIIKQDNAGVSAARNRGIKEAGSELIAFLDADDYWKEDYLQTQMDLVKKYPQCVVWATAYEIWNSHGTVTPIILNKINFKGHDGILKNYFEVAACSSPPVWTSAVVIRKSELERVGGFPEGIGNGEDLLTWAKLFFRGLFAYTIEPKAVYLVDEELYNEDQKKRIPARVDYVGQELEKMYRHNECIPGLKSYVGLWYKMRGRHAISRFNRSLAARELCKALKYSLNIKSVVLLGLCFLPLSLSNKIIRRFSS